MNERVWWTIGDLKENKKWQNGNVNTTITVGLLKNYRKPTKVGVK